MVSTSSTITDELEEHRHYHQLGWYIPLYSLPKKHIICHSGLTES